MMKNSAREPMFGADSGHFWVYLGKSDSLAKRCYHLRDESSTSNSSTILQLSSLFSLFSSIPMSRQDKATTDRNAKILRELVKHPENKQCADCRRNDARWASWNLGCFMCIRCSGIHRSMGTHISKVKSVDLDIWTPEQMDNIQRWGNKLANLYWEAHLKPGHIPSEHKIESFIRSKYESRRWAMSGPVPSDPQVLLQSDRASNVSATPPPVPEPQPQPQARAPPTSVRSNIAHPLLSRQVPTSTSTAPAAPPPPPSGAAPAPALAPVAAPAPAPAPAQQPAASTASASLFDLDFHAPAPTSSSSAFGNGANKSSAQKKSGIDDIMSLFSAPSTAAPAPPSTYGGGASNNWQQPQQSATTAGMGGLSSGFGGLSLGGGGQDVWGQPASRLAPPLQQQQPQQQPRPSNGGSSWGDFQSHGMGTGAATSSIWDASPAPASSSQDIWASSAAKPSTAAPKDDLFADIWK